MDVMQNFGNINETFKNILLEGILSNKAKNKKIFSRYLTELKKNKTLRFQYDIFNKLENKVEANTEPSNMLVDECISALKSVGVDKLKKENDKLIKFITKNNYKLNESEYDYKELHNHINNLVFSVPSGKNIESIVESKLYLKTYKKDVGVITESKSVEYFENKLLAPILLNKFNEKYAEISEDEKKAFNIILNGNEEEKKNLYENSIKECIDLVNENLKNCTIDEKDKLLQVKDRLLRYKYNEQEYVSEISKIVSLKSKLI